MTTVEIVGLIVFVLIVFWLAYWLAYGTFRYGSYDGLMGDEPEDEKMTYYDTIGTPGSDSEYFAEDHDQVYCVHGCFIGYPGGADFICGLCEDGATKLEHRMVARLCYIVPDDPDWPYVFSTHYSAAGMQKDNDLFSLLKKEAGKIGTEWYWEFDIESYWVQPE